MDASSKGEIITPVLVLVGEERRRRGSLEGGEKRWRLGRWKRAGLCGEEQKNISSIDETDQSAIKAADGMAK